VVADEVRKLAEQSTTTVKKIQNIVVKVNDAFKNISVNAEEILKFMETRVTPDYQLLVNTGGQYEEDAQFFSKISLEISQSAEQMSRSIDEVSKAIENASLTSQQAAASSEDILKSVTETTLSIDEVSKSAQTQAELAENLNNMVKKFRI
jgi:methyl-accepting chemotaxis protein